VKPFAKLAAIGLGLALATGTAALAETPPGALYGAKPGTPDISGVWVPNSKRGSNWSPTPKFIGDYQKLFERRVAGEKNGKPLADLGSRCLPTGMPSALLLSGYPTEIIETPGRVTLIKENLSQTLRIWTDGRPVDPEVDPTFLGTSTGHWEGDTLVVDIVGIRDEGLLDAGRTMPHSNKLHLTMRLHKIDPNTLEMRFEAEDPLAFEGKSNAVAIFEKHDDFEVMEQYCEAPGFVVNADGTLSEDPADAPRKRTAAAKKVTAAKK
jgi:hypothetical protein